MEFGSKGVFVLLLKKEVIVKMMFFPLPTRKRPSIKRWVSIFGKKERYSREENSSVCSDVILAKERFFQGHWLKHGNKSWFLAAPYYMFTGDEGGK